jgi:DNA mismatch repair ATPase MutS
LLQGLSGFSIEMREMSTILHNANFRTLIVVDELARSE